MDKSSSPTKRPSASCELKTKQGQVNKTKEILGRNTGLSSQVNVKTSKSETNLKRKSSEEDSCDRPSSKRKPANMVKLVSKGVQKTADNKQTKGLCKSTRKTEVGKGGTCSLGLKNSVTKSAPSTNYKVLMTRPCSVPVVPMGTPPRIGQQRSGTVLVLKKVLPSAHMEVKMIPARKSLEPLEGNLSDENINKNVEHVVHDLSEEMAETGLEVQAKPGLEENGDGGVSERTISVKTESIPECVTDCVENDSAMEEKTGSHSTMPECEPQSNQSKEDSSESEKVKCNRLMSHDAECIETKESETENVVIKRSARISEKRAKINISDLLPWNEKSQRLISSEESNLVKMTQSDCHQSNLAFNALNNDVSNQTTKTDPLDINTTQHRSTTSSNTKYTKRMSWQLHPQMIPVDKIDPVSVGDIVWGKVHGHPWWPGKVLAISGIRNEDSRNPWDRDAHVSWFGSNTSSIMCLHGLQLFLPNFSKRHKRRKKGFYRVAVRQAQEAAQAMVDKDGV